MRKELQIIELIDRYLRNELSKEERQAFENKLHSNDSLRNEVNMQKELLEGLESLGIKQDIKTAKRKYFNRNKGLYYGISVGLIIVSFTSYYFNSSDSKYSTKQPTTIELIEDSTSIETIPITTDDTIIQEVQSNSNKVEVENFELPSKGYQYFNINQNRDTILIGREGTIIEIKENSFNTNSNDLTIRLKEYYKMSDIAFSNLTTMTTKSEIIETGGMIYVDAVSKGGKKLELNRKKKIDLKFPYTKKKADMKLFTGETNQDNLVQWNVVQGPEIFEEVESIGDESERLLDTLTPTSIFTIVENMPVFQGCEEIGNKEKIQECTYIGTQSYIKENIKYPADASSAGVSGTVYIRYIIDQNGFVSNVDLLRGIYPSIDNEAMRVIRSLPRYEPGTQRGINVSVQFTIPIKFNYLGDADFRGFTNGEINSYNDSVMQLRREEKSKLMKDKIESIEKSIDKSNNRVEGKVSTDIEYYIFSSSGLGWINCDRFIRDRREKINYALNDIPEESRVRIIFNKIKGITGGYWKNDKYNFSRLPIGEEVTIFVIKQFKGQTYICFQEAKISKRSPELKFKKATIEDIKTYSKKMNEIHS